MKSRRLKNRFALHVIIFIILNCISIQFTSASCLNVLRIDIQKRLGTQEVLSNSRTNSHIINSLEGASFTKDQFSIQIIRGLDSKEVDESKHQLLGISHKEQLAIWDSFEFTNQSQIKIKVKSKLFLGNSSLSPDRELNLVALFEMQGSDQPVGFFVISFNKHALLGIRPYLEMIKIDTSNLAVKGIASKLLPFILDQLKHFGLSQFELESDWYGRVVWSKRNFSFNSDLNFYKDGESISQLSLMRENLGRFLERRNLLISQLLTTRSSGEVVQLNSLEDLVEPIEFVNIVHKDGRKLKVRKYVDEDFYEKESEENIGIAFSLMGYAPRKGQRLELSTYTGEAISDEAMFPWLGIYRLK